jgi:hypothetical protein
MSATTPSPARKQVRVQETKDGRDEMNIAEFPIALLSDRAPRGTKTVEYQDTIWDQHSGQPVTRKLVVQGTDRLGLPTAKDDEVMLGLIQITRLKNNFADRKVHFSRYELVHLLGWNDDGKSYRRIEESLHRWASVYLSYEKAWWDNRRKSWVDEGFHILERISLYEREGGQQKSLPFSSFTWGEVFFRSFQDGYLKALDLEFFLSLQSATAKRIYRFLDKHFYHRMRLEYDLHDFAHEHVGLSREYHTGKIKEKLTPALQELESRGFLEPLPASERYHQVRRGEWKIIFVKKGQVIEAKSKVPAAKPQEKELTDRGVTASVALELASGCSPERIARKIEVFDWLKEKKDPRVSKNPAGYLVQSIRQDYQPPDGFESKAEREAKKVAQEKARQQREEKRLKEEESHRQKKAEDEAKRLAKRQHVDGYLAGLSESKRRSLLEQAFANAESHMRSHLKKEGKIGEVMRELAIDNEVLRIHPMPESEACV